MARFLLILMLLWQPLALRTAAASLQQSNVAVSHGASGCCEIVEVIEVIEVDTCCEPVIESRCDVTGGACHCDSAPGQPLKPAPMLSTTKAPERSLPATPSGDMIVTAAPRNAFASHQGVHERNSRSHNTFQAMIGIWRT